MNSTLQRLAASGAATALLAGGAVALAAHAHASDSASTPKCLNSQLKVSVHDVGIDDEGIYNLHLDFKNISHRTCHLNGYPGVAAVGPHGKQLGDAAIHNGTWPARSIVLTPGYTAHSMLAYNDYRAHQKSCAPATASGFRVYPPGDRHAMYAPYKVSACTKRGPRYEFLSVGRVKSAGYP